VMVVLDTNLTPELIQEGYVREVISKIQTMRKDAGFEVTDRIEVCCECNDVLAEAIETHREMIENSTLAVNIYLCSFDGGVPQVPQLLDLEALYGVKTVTEEKEQNAWKDAKEWKINGQKAVIAVRVAK